MKLDFVSYNSVELYRIYSLHYFFMKFIITK